MSELENEFKTVQEQIHCKLVEARKLIEEADKLAHDQLHLTIHGADSDGFEDLQSIMEDTGFVTEREVSWDSSGCYFG